MFYVIYWYHHHRYIYIYHVCHLQTHHFKLEIYDTFQSLRFAWFTSIRGRSRPLRQANVYEILRIKQNIDSERHHTFQIWKTCSSSVSLFMLLHHFTSAICDAWSWRYRCVNYCRQLVDMAKLLRSVNVDTDDLLILDTEAREALEDTRAGVDITYNDFITHVSAHVISHTQCYFVHTSSYCRNN